MSCFKQLKLSPRELSTNVKRESCCHKAKVVGWSAFMAWAAGVYLFMFSDVTNRAQQLQNQALAGQLHFNDYEAPDPSRLFTLKVMDDIYAEKNAKDLKYIQMGWKSQVDPDTKTAQGVQFGTENGWYTQTRRFEDWPEVNDQVPTDLEIAQAQVDNDAELYEQWKKMHAPSVSWFDTAGCNLSTELRAQYGVIGDANMVVWEAQSEIFARQPAFSTYLDLKWWKGTRDATEPFVTGEVYANWASNMKSVNPTIRGGAMLAIYTAQVKIQTYCPQSESNPNCVEARAQYAAASAVYDTPGTIDLADDFDIMRRNVQNVEDMVDCDIDCQVKGSQLTLVAALNSASLSLILLNGLLGVWGGWSIVGRIAQTYCTFIACLLQFAIFISCATMLFTPYAQKCYSSMFPTNGRNALWTMHDDYMLVIGLWGSQFFLMFIFLVIGLCGAYRSDTVDPTTQVNLMK